LGDGQPNARWIWGDWFSTQWACAATRECLLTGAGTWPVIQAKWLITPPRGGNCGAALQCWRSRHHTRLIPPSQSKSTSDPGAPVSPRHQQCDTPMSNERHKNTKLTHERPLPRGVVPESRRLPSIRCGGPGGGGRGFRGPRSLGGYQNSDSTSAQYLGDHHQRA